MAKQQCKIPPTPQHRVLESRSLKNAHARHPGGYPTTTGNHCLGWAARHSGRRADAPRRRISVRHPACIARPHASLWSLTLGVCGPSMPPPLPIPLSFLSTSTSTSTSASCNATDPSAPGQDQPENEGWTGLRINRGAKNALTIAIRKRSLIAADRILSLDLRQASVQAAPTARCPSFEAECPSCEAKSERQHVPHAFGVRPRA